MLVYASTHRVYTGNSIPQLGSHLALTVRIVTIIAAFLCSKSRAATLPPEGWLYGKVERVGSEVVALIGFDSGESSFTSAIHIHISISNLGTQIYSFLTQHGREGVTIGIAVCVYDQNLTVTVLNMNRTSMPQAIQTLSAV